MSEHGTAPSTDVAPFGQMLAGVRVVDFCWVGAGALVTKLLADLGAQVIKVESRRRPDNLRTSPPFKSDAEGLDASGYFASRNTSKQSFALNMKHPGAQEVALELVRRSDVVTNNYRPGVMERFGLGYDEVRRVNPQIIYLSMPMQGNDGPNRDYIGFGSTILAVAGLTDPSGLPDRPPVGTGTQYPDHVPNPGHALVALLAALLHREATGEGQEIELSQLESTINCLGPTVVAHSVGGGAPVRRGNRSASACPHGVFPCAGDDAWCAIEVHDDGQWCGLVAALGSPSWADEPGLATFEGRKRDEDRLEHLIADITRGWDKHALTETLQGHGVPAGAVATSRDVANDPHLHAREYWHRPPHDVLGGMAINGAPFRVNGQPLPPVSAAPLLGAHTREVATELLGYSDASFDELVAAGLFE